MNNPVAADYSEGYEEPHPLDLRRIAELKPLRNGSLLAQLVAGYVEQGRREVAALRAAVTEGRLQDGVSLAHSLKSSSLNIGAQLVGTICRRLESDLIDGYRESLDTLCQELEISFEQTVASLRELTG